MGSTLVTFRIVKEQYEAFQECCSNRGTTVSEELRHYINHCLSPSRQLPIEERIRNLEERIRRAKRQVKIYTLALIGAQKAVDDIKREIDDRKKIPSKLVNESTIDKPKLATNPIKIASVILMRISNAMAKLTILGRIGNAILKRRLPKSMRQKEAARE